MEAEGTGVEKLAHDINLLCHDQKFTRLQGLKSIDGQLSNQKIDASPQLLDKLESDYPLRKNLVHLLQDPFDKCRDLAATIILRIVRPSTSSEWLRLYLPITLQRLTKLEESREEIRLLLLQLLLRLETLSFAPSSNANADISVADIISVIKLGLLDPFDDVKREACACLQTLFQLAGKEPRVRLTSTTSVAILAQLLSHHKSPVRQSVLETLRILVCNGGDSALDESVIGALMVLTSDRSPKIREIAAETSFDWLKALRIEESLRARLLSILLIGLSDEQESVRDLSAQRVKELEKGDHRSIESLKLDDHQSNVPTKPLLITQLMPQLLSSVLPNLSDWNLPTRLRAVNTLKAILEYARESTDPHVPSIVDGIATTLNDEDPSVVKAGKACCQAIGSFVSPPSYLRSILPQIRGETVHNTLPSRMKSILVLSMILKGVKGAGLLSHAQEILETLLRPDVSYVPAEGDEIAMDLLVLKVVKRLIHILGDSCSDNKVLFASLLLRIKSTNQPQLLQKSDESMKLLSLKVGRSSADLTSEYLKETLPSLMKQENCAGWTEKSPQLGIWATLVTNSSVSSVLESMNELIPMFRSLTSKSAPVETRTRALAVLLHLIRSTGSKEASLWLPWIPVVIEEIVLPNTVWSAGAASIETRQKAISCAGSLLTLLSAPDLKKDTAEPIKKTKVLASIVSCIDDSFFEVRRVAVSAVSSYLEFIPLEGDEGLNLCTQLLKRLDDSHDQVRIEASKAIGLVLSEFLSTSPHEDKYLSIVNALLIHLDDSNAAVQNAVASAMKEAIRIRPDKVEALLRSVRNSHHTQIYCDQLIQFAQENQANK